MNMNKYFRLGGLIFTVLLLGFGCQQDSQNVSDKPVEIKDSVVVDVSSTIPTIETLKEIPTTEMETSTPISFNNLKVSDNNKSDSIPRIKDEKKDVNIVSSINLTPPPTNNIVIPAISPVMPVNTNIQATSSPVSVVAPKPLVPVEQPKVIDLCRNIPKNQTEIPLGMYKSVDGDCFPIPVPKVEQPPTKPTITKLASSPAKGRPGQTVKVTYKSENATVCALSNVSNIEVPFVGNLAEGVRDIELQQGDFKDNKFTFYLICADKDWNTVTKTLVIDYDPVFDSVQPTSFFSANGGNIGGGGTGSLNGVPFVAISPLKSGATAVVVMNGRTYPLDSDGIHFFFNDLSFDPTWTYAGSCTTYSYVINFSYQDENNSHITGSSSGGFCLNNLNQP